MLTVILIIVIIIIIAYGVYSRNAENKTIFDFMTVWTDHLVYTRLFLMEFLNDGPTLDKLKVRLLKNHDEIGKLFGSFYGKENGDKLTELMNDHTQRIIEVLSSIKEKGDLDKVPLYKNADEIGTFIDTIKGSGPMFKDQMKEQIDALISLITSYAEKDWTRDIEQFDEYLHSGMYTGFTM